MKQYTIKDAHGTTHFVDADHHNITDTGMLCLVRGAGVEEVAVFMHWHGFTTSAIAPLNTTGPFKSVD